MPYRVNRREPQRNDHWDGSHRDARGDPRQPALPTERTVERQPGGADGQHHRGRIVSQQDHAQEQPRQGELLPLSSLRPAPEVIQRADAERHRRNIEHDRVRPENHAGDEREKRTRPPGGWCNPAPGPGHRVETSRAGEEKDEALRHVWRRTDDGECGSFDDVEERRVGRGVDHGIPREVPHGKLHGIAGSRAQEVPPEQSVHGMPGRVTLEPQAVRGPVQPAKQPERDENRRCLPDRRAHRSAGRIAEIVQREGALEATRSRFGSYVG